jgi:hypothetical protein
MVSGADLDPLDAETVGLNPAEGMDVCSCLFTIIHLSPYHWCYMVSLLRKHRKIKYEKDRSGRKHEQRKQYTPSWTSEKEMTRHYNRPCGICAVNWTEQPQVNIQWQSCGLKILNLVVSHLESGAVLDLGQTWLKDNKWDQQFIIVNKIVKPCDMGREITKYILKAIFYTLRLTINSTIP